MATFTRSPETLLPQDTEPDDTWKQALKANVEAGLRSMFDEAKRKFDDELASLGVISDELRKHLTNDYVVTLKHMRLLAEEWFHTAVEHERQERRWVSDQLLDGQWSESMIEEQQAIMDGIEKELRNKGSALSQASSTPPPTLPNLPPPVQSQPKLDIISENSTHSLLPFSRNPLTRMPPLPEPECDKSVPAPSPDYGKLESTPRSSRTPIGPVRKKNNHNPSMNIRPVVQQTSRPSTMIKKDTAILMPHLLTRPTRSSIMSQMSSFKVPSVVSDAFTDPFEVLLGNDGTESSANYEQVSIDSVVQEWAVLNCTGEGDREQGSQGYARASDHSVHKTGAATSGFEERQRYAIRESN